MTPSKKSGMDCALIIIYSLIFIVGITLRGFYSGMALYALYICGGFMILLAVFRLYTFYFPVFYDIDQKLTKPQRKLLLEMRPIFIQRAELLAYRIVINLINLFLAVSLALEYRTFTLIAFFFFGTFQIFFVPYLARHYERKFIAQSSSFPYLIKQQYGKGDISVSEYFEKEDETDEDLSFSDTFEQKLTGVDVEKSEYSPSFFGVLKDIKDTKELLKTVREYDEMHEAQNEEAQRQKKKDEEDGGRYI